MFRPTVPTSLLAFGFALALCLTTTTAAQEPMPVQEINAGMRGYGLSVFQGTEPERFGVEIIGVLHNFRPTQDLILARTEHPVLEKANTVAGMSGSPIYINDRLIGAYAYGWTFGTEPVIGITPIHAMLSAGGPTRNPTARPIDLSTNAPQSSHGPTRTQTPLMVAGWSETATNWLNHELAPHGFVAVPAGANSPTNVPKSQGPQPPKPFVPGGAIGVQLLRGDLNATAIGTVTHVDTTNANGTKVYAFGHPMLELGNIALPTARARIVHVLASATQSFKIGETTTPLGTLVHDNPTTIIVDPTQTAPTLPLQIRVHRPSVRQTQTWDIEAAIHPSLTPMLVQSAVINAVQSSLHHVGPTGVRVTTELHTQPLGTLRFTDSGFSSDGAATTLAFTKLRLRTLLHTLMDNPFEPASLQRIAVDVYITEARNHWAIEHVRLSQEQATPGVPLQITVQLRSFDGIRHTETLHLAVPRSSQGDHIELHVTSGTHAKQNLPAPTNLRTAIENILEQPPAHDLVVSARIPSRGMRLHDHVVPQLPASALNTLALRSSSERGIPSWSTIEQTRTLSGTVTGNVVLRIPLQPPHTRHTP